VTTKAESAVKALVGFGAGIVVSTVATLTFIDGRIERASASAAVSQVEPVRRDLEAHLRDVRAAGLYMKQYAQWSSQTIYALCKANRNADCPNPPTWSPQIGGTSNE
jgi:hypothetical protein